MTIITRSSLVMFSPDKMFDLVNDITAYPHFLPWCRSSKILTKTEQVIEAELNLAKGGLQHVFSTKNTLIPNKSIDITLIDGPFKHLEGRWTFNMIGNNQGCRIQLDMDFEFSNRIISLALEPIFTQISGSLVNSFCQRAQDIYGTD